MTYPGLVLLVGVGIGLATFLYHVFTESNRATQQQQRCPRNRRFSSHYEDWTERSHRSENAFLNRRRSSNSSTEAIDVATSSMEDVNNCSICQYALSELDVIQLNPCRHNFHRGCIDELRKYDSQASCPNCRREINTM